MTPDLAAAERALAAIPGRFPGPGGIAGIVHEGRVIARAAWGWADPALRLPMTTATRLPICSITKQFTCAALIETCPDTGALDPLVAEALPNLTGPRPTAAQLAHNQSGLRDTWALTTVIGARPEGRFTQADVAPLLASMRTTHFAPGSRYSYSNGNFRILADLVERVSGRPIAEHYARLFDRWGMAGALLDADTARPADGVVGHEGSAATVHVPALNRIWWQGDAGIAASLDDMLAYEMAIDAMRDRPDSLYGRLSAPVRYADGTPATYGWGLAHETVGGLAVTGHGGALRGFRSQRFHAAAARLSVFVALTHEASAHAAASSVIEAAAGWVAGEVAGDGAGRVGDAASAPGDGAAGDDAGGQDAAGRGILEQRGSVVAPTPAGTWLDEDSGLLLTLGDGMAHFGTASEPVPSPHTRFGPAPGRPAGAAGAGSLGGGSLGGVALEVQRLRENWRFTARPVPPLPEGSDPDPGIAGRYACDETASEIEVVQTGGAFWAAFQGALGRGPMEPLIPVGTDLWALWTRRGMDAPAPGRWTVQVRRDDRGGIVGLRVGCWLARDLRFARIR